MASTRVYEIIKEGKHLHRYEVWHKGILQGWMIGESQEAICRLYKWNIDDCKFILEPFFMWDRVGATVVKEVNN